MKRIKDGSREAAVAGHDRKAALDHHTADQEVIVPDSITTPRREQEAQSVQATSRNIGVQGEAALADPEEARPKAQGVVEEEAEGKTSRGNKWTYSHALLG